MLHEGFVKRFSLVHSIMLLCKGAVNHNQFGSDQFQAALFQAGDDLTYQSALNAIGFD